MIGGLRGASSSGRALPWHGRGEQFKSAALHQVEDLGKVVRKGGFSFTPPLHKTVKCGIIGELDLENSKGRLLFASNKAEAILIC